MSLQTCYQVNIHELTRAEHVECKAVKACDYCRSGLLRAQELPRQSPCSLGLGSGDYEYCMFINPFNLLYWVFTDVVSGQPVQNVVVELSYNVRPPTSSKANGPTMRKTAYAGWSGMPSRLQQAPFMPRNNVEGRRGGGNADSSLNEVQGLEIDKTFGQLLALADGQKVRLKLLPFEPKSLMRQQIDLSLHLDSPAAHTVSIEPLTAADWESQLLPSCQM